MGKNYFVASKHERVGNISNNWLESAKESIAKTDKVKTMDYNILLRDKTPLKNNMIVKPFVAKTVSDGGMFVPESAQVRPSKALVIAVGSGTEKNPMILKEGDIVFHVKGAGEEYNIDGEDVFLIRSTDCLAYIPKEN